jgi:hypothetical protein
MTLRKGYLKFKEKHQLALCGELAMQEAMDLSQDSLQNEYFSDVNLTSEHNLLGALRHAY